MKTPTSSWIGRVLFFLTPASLIISAWVWVYNHPDDLAPPTSEITTNGAVYFKLEGHYFYNLAELGQSAAVYHSKGCACGWVEKLKAVGGWGTTNGGPFPVTNGVGR